MAKELPYFKFFVSEWIAGDITLCSMEAQGVFANIMAYYWTKDCSICLANVKQRFSKHETSIEELLFQKIIKLDENDNIIINFLDEQMEGFSSISEKRTRAGRKGGKANAKQMLSKAKAKPIYKEKIREEKRREDNKKGKNFKTPTLEEIKNYCSERKNDVDSTKFKNFYESKGWMIGKNKMKDWKAAVRTWETPNKTGKINDIWDT